MFKKIIALSLVFALLSGLVVTADAEESQTDKENKLYCLSDNKWKKDYDELLYKELGIELENHKTGATYSYVGESDLQIIEQDPDLNKLTGGQADILSVDTGVWGGWMNGQPNTRQRECHILFDLKDSYWVTKADIWSSSWNMTQVDTMTVSVGNDLNNMMTLPSVKAYVPTKTEIENAPDGKYTNYTTVEFDAVKVRYVKITTDRGEFKQYASGHQQTLTEAAIFGYLEKPTELNDEAETEAPMEISLAKEVLSPEFDQYNAYVLDLGEVKRVTEVNLTEYRSKVSALDGYEVWLSSDGYSYAETAYVPTRNKATTGDFDISYKLQQMPYCRYIKIVAKKAVQREKFNVRKIQIFAGNSAEEQRIDDKATYTYWEQHPYQTNTDIMLQDKELKVLTDGDKETCITTFDKWATVVFDLGEAYQIGNVDIYSKADAANFLEGAEIRYSLDNKKWFTYTYYVNTNEKNNGIVKSSFSGQPGRNARYLKIIMQSAEHAISVSEIEINGYQVEMAKMSETPQVPLRVEMKNYLLAYLDWSTFNVDNASKFSVYIEKTPFTSTKSLTPKATYERFDNAFKNKYTTYQPLEPETTYYFAVTAYDDLGQENQSVTPIEITTEQVLGDEVGETFNITHHPTMAKNIFGSYRNTQNADIIRLYDELGASDKTCGWTSTGIAAFAEIGVSCSVLGPIAGLTEMGSYMSSYGNELDLYGTAPQDFLAGQINTYNSYKALSPKTVVTMGRMGGVDDKCINWLTECFEYDRVALREHSDVLDVHLYTKTGYKQIPGLPVGCPELLPWMLERIKGVLTKYNAEMPIVSTEIGYNTSDTQGIDVNLFKAFVPRAYMLLISEGVREAWWYAFQDEGVDVNDRQHQFGIVDFMGVPKAPYYSYYNIFYQLRYSDYLGAVSGLSNPYYGFEFYDETKGKVISSAWAADGKEMTLTFETLSGEDELVEIITYDGGFKTVQTVGGKGSVLLGAGPVYIYTKEGVKATSIARAFNLVDFTKTATKGQEVTLSIKRDRLGAGVGGYVSSVSMPAGWTIVGDTSFDNSQETIDVTIQIANTTTEGEKNITLRVCMDDGRIENVDAVIDVKPYMSVQFIPEPVTFGNWKDWRIAAVCTNTATIPLEGRISCLSSSGTVITTKEAQIIKTIQPGETTTVYFDTSEIAENTFVEVYDGYCPPAVGTFMLEVNGERTMIERKLNFSACVDDGITPVMDGVISEGEWDNCHVLHMEETPNDNGRGPDSCACDIMTKWDSKNFYLLVDVTDDVHFSPYSGSEIFAADGLQIGLDFNRKEGVSTSDTTMYFELGLAAEEGTMKPLTWAWYTDLIIKTSKPIDTAVAGITRTEDNHTIYEMAIPWIYLMEEGDISDHKIIGFSLTVNDADKAGVGRHFIEIGGIACAKNPNMFGDLVLIKK